MSDSKYDGVLNAGTGNDNAGDSRLEQPTESSQANKKDSNTTYLDATAIADFTKALSGKDQNGESKVVISYQSYAMEEPEDSVDKQRIYSTSKPHIELSIDNQYPSFYVMDIIFRSYDDPELKMLWGRLQRFKRNMANDPQKTWIFYFNILEKDSITTQTVERDTLFLANVFNPTIFFLTREVPDMLAVDEYADDGKLHGGNTIRMLIPIEFVSFQVTNEVDTSEIKGEIMRENSDREYLNNPDMQSTWNE